jgi:hypothetical protein
MVPLPTINLPVLVLIHAIFLTVAGLRMLFRRTAKPDLEAEATAMAGIAYLAIGVAYLSTSYMPISENQFLHASVPVRIGLALVAGLRLVLVDNISQGGYNQMLFTLLYDGIGGIVCGWRLGNFTGRV